MSDDAEGLAAMRAETAEIIARARGKQIVERTAELNRAYAMLGDKNARREPDTVEASDVARLANGDDPLHTAIETALTASGYHYNINVDAWRKVVAVALLALLLPCAALAQPTQSTMITPAPLSGFGTLSVATTSIAVSTATVGPNSAVFPFASLGNRYLEVRNSVGSASTLYVCPLGGTCSSTVGVPLATGETKTWFIPPSASGALVSPTVISGGTATAVLGW